MYWGLIRTMDYRGEGHEFLDQNPHINSLPTETCELSVQLSCNIYLRVPARDCGGELQVWDLRDFALHVESLTPEIIEYLEDAHTYLVQNDARPIYIRQNEGDLVIINTRKIHAVKSINQPGTDIMSIQTCLGYQGPGKPLVAWN